MENKRKSLFKRIISISLAVFFVLSFTLLIFATVSLKNNKASLFGHHLYYVTTKSMEPDIHKGSFVIAKITDTEELKVGDVISFVSRDPDIAGMINTHNIDKISYDTNGKPVFTTKGSNNPTADKYPVYPEDIRGRVVYNSLFIGKVFKAVSNKWVSFCITVLPILVIVLVNFIDLVKVINFFPDDDVKKEKNINSQKGGN